MTIRDLIGKVQDVIPVRNVLLSVSEKAGLGDFVRGLIMESPEVVLMSTGGTYKLLSLALPERDQARLVEVSQYTGFPEMDGGLVKTLHPKIHAGILGERGNPKHHSYLKDDLNGGVFIDMVVANLYPFQKKIAETGVTFEGARGNIDIGGPSMVRGAAKNFPGCAVVTDPDDYRLLLDHIRDNGGGTTFAIRFELSKKAFEMTAGYDACISSYLKSQKLEDIRLKYNFTEK